MVSPLGPFPVARGNAAVAREQGIKERTVIVEYPSLEKATAALRQCGVRGSLEGARRWRGARFSDR
jgi:hypothetical protein